MQGMYNADHVEQYVKEIGKDQMIIFPSGPPVQGFKGKFDGACWMAGDWFENHTYEN